MLDPEVPAACVVADKPVLQFTPIFQLFGRTAFVLEPKPSKFCVTGTPIVVIDCCALAETTKATDKAVTT